MEHVHPGDVDPASSLPVGAALRARREQLGWSLADVAAWLRIKLSYLEALEGGQVGRLPGNAYALGFLRAYSGVLGLDAEDMSRRFRHETKDVNRRPELSFPAPVPERGVPAGAVVLLGVVVVAVAYVGWYELSGRERRIAQAVPPVPAALAPYAGPAGSVTVPSPQVATVMPGPGMARPGQPPSPPRPAVEGAPGVPSTATGSGGSAAAGATGTPADADAGGVRSTPPPAPITSPSPLNPPAPAPAVAGGQVPAASVPSVPGQITVEAVATSWVQVREVGGKVLYDHVLKSGDTWTVPADPLPLTLATGNAGGVRLMADGVTSPVLGRVGGVRRAIPLSAQAIKDGSIATARAAPAEATAGDARHPAPDRDTLEAAPVRHDRSGQAVAPASDDATDRLNERQLNKAAPP